MTTESLLFEAYRRNKMADSFERAKPLDRRWLGLGTASVYRPALEAGLMQWHDGKEPPKRCMGWLVLTETGIKEMRRLTPKFKSYLAALNNNPAYYRSYAAHYQLAGGLRHRGEHGF